ncbi:DinB family protein [Allokutzneria oryzae]|uniref:DinB family protein n=1 Tax=Allokutzneria oryzae TaxID=1378989 RepID=A0ABV5ZSX4_9PSEU
MFDAGVARAPLVGAVRDGGVFVAVVPPGVPEPERGIRVERVEVRPDAARLRELVAGGLSTRLAAVLPLAEVAETHRRAGGAGRSCSACSRYHPLMEQKVPFTGEEKESLRISLDRHRDVVLWKVEGLDDERLRQRVTPSGTSLLGLVKHLAYVENGWFSETFGRPVEPVDFDTDDPEADLRIEPHETTADVLDYYRRARAASDAVIAEFGLEDTGTAWFGEKVTLRWVLIHLIEETARHVGHMDILRELLDGTTGSHRRSSAG